MNVEKTLEQLDTLLALRLTGDEGAYGDPGYSDGSCRTAQWR